MKVLTQLWTQEAGEPLNPWGNVFRQEILDIMEKIGLDIEGIDPSSGSIDVLHFNLTEFEDIFSKESSSDNANADLLGLYCNELLVGFKLVKDGESNGLFVNPSAIKVVEEIDGTYEF